MMIMHQMFHFIKQLSGRLNPSLYSSLPSQSNAASIAFLRQLQREIRAEDVLHIPFPKLKLTVFDLETTGFYPQNGDRILSIGAVKVIGDQVLDDETYYSLVNYNEPLSEDVKLLTGLSEEELSLAPPIEQVLQEFYQFIKSEPLVAHHAHHEKRFMQHATWSTLKMSFQHRLLDTSFLINIVEPRKNLVTLDDCCTHFGISISRRHHALHDAIGTAKFWVECIRQIKKLGFVNLLDVYNYLAKTRY